ncbi:MAG TPA: hypothetical protein VD838_01740, partial [Anaeromyxobacteraceae bacterium]|nr:hypothetical protein [Anaeromyxobacteraceae bacterium]
MPQSKTPRAGRLRYAFLLTLLTLPNARAQQPAPGPDPASLTPGALLPQPGDTLRVHRFSGVLASGDDTLQTGEFYEGLNV